MLRIRLHSPECVYAAALAPGARAMPEWPPSPWRVASALLAGTSSLDEPDRARARCAVERLENAEAPLWWLPPATQVPRPKTWAALTEPDSATAGQLGRVLQWPQAVHGMADRRTRYEDVPVRVDMHLPTAFLDIDVDLPEQELHAISKAALLVPYVGRSTHPIDLGVLTPDGHGGWLDHTSSSGACDPMLAGPEDQHEQWLPGRRGGTPVRCWNPGMVVLLDDDHRRRSANRAGVVAHLKGRTVHYAPTRKKTSGTWISIGLLRPLHDVQTTMRSLAVEEGAVLPVMRRGRLVALLCRDPAVAAMVQRFWPDGIATGTRAARSAHRFLEAATRWSSVVPVAAHPDERVARAQLRRELADVGEVTELRLRPAIAADCPAPGLSAWRVEITFAAPVRGPLRIGAAAESGAGMCAAHDEASGGM